MLFYHPKHLIQFYLQGFKLALVNAKLWDEKLHITVPTHKIYIDNIDRQTNGE